MIIVLVGASGSGKSTLQKVICKNYKMTTIVSCTTRPPRQGEVNGEDYYFIDYDKFEQAKKENYFIETAVYNNWHYGLAKNRLVDNSVVVLTPSGLRRLIKYNNSLEEPYEIISFYIDVDQRSRLIKLLQRGDDIMEAIRRSLSDVGQFDDVGNETTYVIKNIEFRFTPEQMFIHLDRALEDYHLNIVNTIYGEGDDDNVSV